MLGKLSTDASKRLMYEAPGMKADKYEKVCQLIMKEFNLKRKGNKTTGLDEIFENYELGNALLSFEWDNWSGFMVVANNKDAEQVVRDIANYLTALNV